MTRHQGLSPDYIPTGIFGLSGYGKVHMTSVYASPGKDGNETVVVSDQPEPVSEKSSGSFPVLYHG